MVVVLKGVVIISSNYDTVGQTSDKHHCPATVIIHTGKCIRRFGGFYAYCRYFLDRKW